MGSDHFPFWGCSLDTAFHYEFFFLLLFYVLVKIYKIKENQTDVHKEETSLGNITGHAVNHLSDPCSETSPRKWSSCWRVWAPGPRGGQGCQSLQSWAAGRTGLTRPEQTVLDPVLPPCPWELNGQLLHSGLVFLILIMRESDIPF